jgi:hypothetical protein
MRADNARWLLVLWFLEKSHDSTGRIAEWFGDEFASGNRMKRKTKKLRGVEARADERRRYEALAEQLADARDENQKRKLKEKLARTPG